MEGNPPARVRKVFDEISKELTGLQSKLGQGIQAEDPRGAED